MINFTDIDADVTLSVGAPMRMVFRVSNGVRRPWHQDPFLADDAVDGALRSVQPEAAATARDRLRMPTLTPHALSSRSPVKRALTSSTT